MPDQIEMIDSSLIQHGPENRRVYLMKAHPDDLPELAEKIESLAKRKGYTKIFAKVPVTLRDYFKRRAYRREAYVPGFYHGRTPAVFLAKYFSKKRQEDPRQDRIEEIIDLAHRKAEEPVSVPGGEFTFREACPDDAPAMAEVYRAVFESYPFPIHDPGYLRETMESHVRYFCAFEGDRMAAVSSCEMDCQARNVEMTDFATLSEYRKKGLAGRLLTIMEDHMRRDGMKMLYTIARAVSAGMNITFARGGYTYAGTLINNTNICGRIESMNVWYKLAK